jgi:hypothetical protein
MNLLKIEYYVLIAILILIVKVWPQLVDIPFLLKATHFILVGIYSVIGVAGVHILILACFHHQKYIEICSNKNPFGVSEICFERIGILFGLIGIILFFGAMRFGSFKKWGRQAVLICSVPYSVLYPSVMATITGSYQLSNADNFIFLATCFLLLLSIISIVICKSKPALKYFRFS